MKLKLLLCYILAATAFCFAASDEDGDEEAMEIVSDPIEAMGRAPRAVAKKVSTAGMVVAPNIGGSDPYAKSSQIGQSLPVIVGDPYAKGMAKVDIPHGDPYAFIGAPTAASKRNKTPVKETSSARAAQVAPLAVAEKKEVKKKASTAHGSGDVSPAFASALFKPIQIEDPLTQEAQAAVLAIDKEVQSRENQLKLVAEEHLTSVKREISEQAAQLRQEADAAARALKSKTEGRVQALLETAEERIVRLNKEVAEESLRLKQEAAKKALSVIDEMELRAAERRLQERKRALAATFGIAETELGNTALIVKKPAETAAPVATVAPRFSPLKPSTLISTEEEHKQKVVAAVAASVSPEAPVHSALRVSAEWKNDLSRRFYQDMTSMKNIIVEAESPVETADFLKKFDEQNKWFDMTLRTTRAVTDESYNQLVAKQAQMSRLMQAQRTADDYLQKFTKNMLIDPVQLKKSRLTILYELNAKTQQRASHLDRSVRESALPDDEIKNLVKRTLSDVSQQFREIAAQFPDVELGGSATRKPQLSLAAVPLAAQQLEEELKEAKEQAAQTKQELETAQQQIASTQKEITQARSILEEERTAKNLLAKEKDGLQKDKEQLVRDKNDIKTTALNLLGTQTRTTMETELALTGARQDSAKLQGELVTAAAKNSTLQWQKRSLVGAVEQARKETMQVDLQRGEEVRRAQKTVRLVQRQAREQIKSLAEAGSKRELALTADLRQAHEKIGVLSAKQAKLAQDLEQQRRTTASLKQSLKVAQEVAGKAEARAELADRFVAENDTIVKRQAVLRKQAQERARITEELAQQTIDSINGFLSKERSSLAATRKQLADKEQRLVARAGALDEREEELEEQQDFLDVYREQLTRDRDMLEGLKLEARKVVEHSAALSESLSEDFVEMQQQIERELRSAQEATKRELSVAQQRLIQMQPATGTKNPRVPASRLAVAPVESDDEEGEKVAKPAIKAIMPGVKQLATKQLPARMPGLAA